MGLVVKICGLRDAATLDAAIEAGADLIGLVSFPRSPRHVAIDAATPLAARARGRAGVIVLLVDPEDAAVEAIVAAVQPDMLQLHGSETPARVAAIKALAGRPVMKALRVAEASDLADVPAYAAVADRLLFDAKPPKTLAGALPGGNGLAFDWRLLAHLDLDRPWMLSGGLDPDNVGEALRLTRAPGVDVSSGVERAPGVKDPERIRAFIAAARAAETRPRANPAADTPARRIA